MFIRLVKKIFSDLKKPKPVALVTTNSNYEAAFAEQAQMTQQPQADRQLQNQFDDSFYDELLGTSPEIQKIVPMEQFIIEQVEKLLSEPSLIINELPVMPQSVSAMMSMMESDDFDIQQLLNLIKQEPAVIASIIGMANTPMYKRSNKPVGNLKTAFVQLGSEGIKETVLMSFIRNFNPDSAIHYQEFGEKIWLHAQQSAIYAKQIALAEKDKKAANLAFIAGLINQLGKMIIFQLIIDAYHVVDAEQLPNSSLIKRLMRERSTSLTLAIADYWQLPAEICNALENPNRVYMSFDSIAAFVSQGSTISQIKYVREAGLRSKELCIEYADKKLISADAASLLYALLEDEALEDKQTVEKISK
ncbi:HDOD domain-containing protein [Catenovulum maritimum]|uniref:HDOD domain-containing protein n=1 Tax=Catenovulum maritimum TaxID=1513271 RepID=UPI000661279B|nr:HDOD domain-containing protein [Catenovulum maritimum]